MGGRRAEAEAFTLNSNETSSNASLIPRLTPRDSICLAQRAGGPLVGAQRSGSGLETNGSQPPPAGMLGKGVNGQRRASAGEESANSGASQLLLPPRGTAHSLLGTRKASVTPSGAPFGGP